MQEQYLAVIEQIIEDNIDNESFSVADLAREAGLSRSMLHRKLIRLTGKSATDLITEIRLRKAFELLENDAGTVSEVAYMVGYSSPSYFNKVFQRTYKVSPGDVRRRGRGKIPHLRVVKEPGDPVPTRSKISRLKAIARPNILMIIIVTFVALALILFNTFQRSRISGNLRNLDKSIAVLPFEIWNSAEEDSYLGDAIASEITTKLANIEEFQVRSFNSSSQFKGQDRPSMEEIGKSLGANIIVVGSLEQQDEEFSIQVRAIRASSDEILWSDLFPFTWDDIFVTRSDITISIAEGLKVALSPEEIEKIEQQGTQDQEAWAYYMKGNYLLHQLDAESCRKAVENYRRAINLDSLYAAAYAGMAFAYYELSIWDALVPDPALIPVVKEWAFKALGLDETLGDPYYVLGAISYMHDWDWEAAEKAFKSGMQRNPNLIWGRSQYSNLLNLMRRFEEAIAISEYSLKRDPLNPAVYIELGGAYWWNGQTEKAYELYLQGMELNPDSWHFKRLLSVYYLEKGSNFQFVIDFCEGMLNQLEKLGLDLQTMPAFALGDVGYLYAQIGHKDKAELIYNELERRVGAGEENTSFMWMGLMHYVWGDIERAVDFLELSYEAREDFLFIINTTPEFDDQELRSNPRFQALIRKLGFKT
jgi:AraC-like DNA-binding protein/TolB-like protein